MLFTNALTYAVALAASLPVVVADYPWNEKTQLYNIGEVPTQNRKQYVLKQLPWYHAHANPFTRARLFLISSGWRKQ